MRLIDADELAVTYCEIDNQYHSEPWILDDILAFLNDAPTIEAAPVVHGRWEAVHDGWGRCPNCHRMDSIHEKATNCRFCGTKMDGGVSDG